MVAFEFGALRGQDVYILSSGPSLADEPLHLLKDKITWGSGDLYTWDYVPQNLDIYSCKGFGGRYNHRQGGSLLVTTYYRQVMDDELTHIVQRFNDDPGSEEDRAYSAAKAVRRIWASRKWPNSENPMVEREFLAQNNIPVYDGGNRILIPVAIDGPLVEIDRSRTLDDGFCGGVEEGPLEWVADSVCSVLVWAVQAAIWMRPTNIYMLGLDLTRRGHVQDRVSGRSDRGEGWEPGGRLFDRAMSELETVRSTCNSLEIGIKNLTYATADRVLPRGRLHDVAT